MARGETTGQGHLVDRVIAGVELLSPPAYARDPGTSFLAPSVFEAKHPAWGFLGSKSLGAGTWRGHRALQGSDVVSSSEVAWAGEFKIGRNRRALFGEGAS